MLHNKLLPVNFVDIAISHNLKAVTLLQWPDETQLGRQYSGNILKMVYALNQQPEIHVVGYVRSPNMSTFQLPEPVI